MKQVKFHSSALILAACFIMLTLPSCRVSSPLGIDESKKSSDMIRIRSGRFGMGSNLQAANLSETPVHTVYINEFFLCKHEVTQSEYSRVMLTNPSFSQDITKPVERVTWLNAVKYCNLRSMSEGFVPCYSVTGYGSNPLTWPSNSSMQNIVINYNPRVNGYRLPTEAEWEYAALGGHLSHRYLYSGSNTPDIVGWYSDTSAGHTHPTMGLLSNELGLYDMSGNVWEWCWDWFAEYSAGIQLNPKGPSTGSFRTMRGGSWYSNANHLTNSYRSSAAPTYSNSNVGFRVARTVME